MRTASRLVALAAALLPLAAFAQPLQDTVEYARVVRVAPIVGPDEAHDVCSVERSGYAPPRERSSAGAVLGGLGGALIGSRFGDGNGKVAATIAGAIGGSMIGDRYANDDRRDAPPPVERCRTVVQPGRTTGYMVTYEYEGRQDTIAMNRDPGQWVRVHKTVTVE